MTRNIRNLAAALGIVVMLTGVWWLSPGACLVVAGGMVTAASIAGMVRSRNGGTRQ